MHGYLQRIAERPRPIRQSRPGRRLTRYELVERDAIIDALYRADGVVVEAANDLGISRATMYRRIKYYGLTDLREPDPAPER